MHFFPCLTDRHTVRLAGSGSTWSLQSLPPGDKHISLSHVHKTALSWYNAAIPPHWLHGRQKALNWHYQPACELACQGMNNRFILLLPQLLVVRTTTSCSGHSLANDDGWRMLAWLSGRSRQGLGKCPECLPQREKSERVRKREEEEEEIFHWWMIQWMSMADLTDCGWIWSGRKK